MSALLPPPDAMAAGQRAAAALVRSPSALKVLARVLVAFGLFVLAALGVTPWQQSVAGSGRVVALAPLERQQDIDAPIEGRVIAWHVREGTKVKAGELLLELSDNDPAILERLREEREAVVDRLEAAKLRQAAALARGHALESSQRAAVGAAGDRVTMAQERTRAARQALEAAQAAVLTARANAQRQERLVEQGLTSQRAVELAQLELVKTTTEVERAQATLQAALGEASALQADRAKVGHDLSAAIEDARAQVAAAQAEAANVAAELARLDVRLARQETMTVRAPIDGTVLRLKSAQGNAFVKAGEPLLTLVPDATERAVELWVDGNDLPLVSEGRAVRLQFEGWPAVQFTGWPSVAIGSFGGVVSLIDATDDGTGRFRVVVRAEQPAAWPEARYLRQGVRVNGWVLLDQVRLGYELWRRLNGFPPVVSTAKVGGEKQK